MKVLRWKTFSSQCCILASTLLMVSLRGYAGVDLDSLRTHRLDSVRVSARRLPEQVKAAMPVQVLAKENIDLLGFTTMGDAIKQFAGVTVRDYGGIGGMQTVSVRSLGACHTAVSYDGVVVSNMQAGQIDVSRYSIDNMAQLSVAIGQNSDLMQSARHYAAAGMLSIETERPVWKGERNWLLSAKLKTGSWGLLSPSLKYSQRMGTSTAISLYGNLLRADGVYPFTLVNGKEKTKEKRYNSDVLSGQGELNIYQVLSKKKSSATNRFSMAVDDETTLDTKVAYCSSKRGLPGVVILYNPDTKERMWDENFWVQSVLKTKLSEKWRLHARLKYAHAWSKYEDYNVKYANGKRTDIDRQNEYYASATVGYDLARNVRVALAEDFSIGNLCNNIESQPNPTRYTNQTAFSLRWKMMRLLMDANVVGTYITERASASSGVAARIPADRKRVSPSFALSYRLLEDEMLYVRGMMKSTYRVPTFTDMYYLQIGNTNLKPENATEWNVGLTWNHGFAPRASQGNTSRGAYLQATLDAYYNKVSDKIVAFPSTYVWRMVNFGKVDITGLDATFALGMPISAMMMVEVKGAYTYQKAVDKTNREKSYYGKQLPYTPRNSGNMSVVWKCPRWLHVGWQMTVCDKRYSMIQGTLEYKLKGYAEHAFTLSKDIAINTCQLHLVASMLNAFNRQYEVIQYYPMPGRSFQVSATLTL